MSKEKVKEIAIEFCVSYTLISICITLINSMQRGTVGPDYANILMCCLWTGIAAIVLNLYPCFEKLSTLAIVVMQYVLALGLVLLSVKVMSYFDPMHPDGYFHVFRSFTLFYVIGAALFYWDHWQALKKQNELLDFIKQNKLPKNS